MARYLQKRKRSSYGGKKRNFKRRRTNRSRGSRVSSTTSKAGKFATIGAFKSRKLSRRKYNHALWNSTMFMPHYRSIASGVSVINTNASAGLCTCSLVGGLSVGSQPFYLLAGGAQALDTGVAVPTFNGDITIRGGTMGIQLANDVADATSQNITVFLVRTGKEYDVAGFPTNVNIGWDPTIVPDFSTNVGKIIMRKEVILENVSSAMVSYRIPIQKIDRVAYLANKNMYVWIIIANSPSGTAATFTVVNYFNLSFVGDAVT